MVGRGLRSSCAAMVLLALFAACAEETDVVLIDLVVDESLMADSLRGVECTGDGPAREPWAYKGKVLPRGSLGVRVRRDVTTVKVVIQAVSQGNVVADGALTLAPPVKMRPELTLQRRTPAIPAAEASQLCSDVLSMDEDAAAAFVPEDAGSDASVSGDARTEPPDAEPPWMPPACTLPDAGAPPTAPDDLDPGQACRDYCRTFVPACSHLGADVPACLRACARAGIAAGSDPNGNTLLCRQRWTTTAAQSQGALRTRSCELARLVSDSETACGDICFVYCHVGARVCGPTLFPSEDRCVRACAQLDPMSRPKLLGCRLRELAQALLDDDPRGRCPAIAPWTACNFCQQLELPLD